MRHIVTIGAVLALAACSQAETPAANNTAAAAITPTDNLSVAAAPSASPTNAAGPILSLAPDGLMLVDAASGSTRQIAFGTPKAATLSAVGAVRGPVGEQGENGECGAGPIAFANFPGGLSLSFQEDKFVGWTVAERGDPKLTTMAGVGVGATRGQLEDAMTAEIAESSLGSEFTAGDMSGVLDGPTRAAKITTLWAGTTCIFR